MIFQQDKPQDWIKPLPDAKQQVIFEEPAPVSHGPCLLPYIMPAFQPSVPPQQAQNLQMPVIQPPQPTGETVPLAWQAYANSGQSSSAAAASTWQAPKQSNWQMNSGTQNWNNQQQGSTWYGTASHGSTTDKKSWWKRDDQAAHNQDKINDGNYAKANFRTGKICRLLPQARDPKTAPPAEFECRFNDESMTHMYSFCEMV
eukprot:5335561-Amphidinium_carterae.1